MDSLVENGDGMSIDDQLATLGLHLTLEAAVGGVILEHVDLKGWKKVHSVLKEHRSLAHKDGSHTQAQAL